MHYVFYIPPNSRLAISLVVQVMHVPHVSHKAFINALVFTRPLFEVTNVKVYSANNDINEVSEKFDDRNEWG